jgi:hypothetical protein
MKRVSPLLATGWERRQRPVQQLAHCRQARHDDRPPPHPELEVPRSTQSRPHSAPWRTVHPDIQGPATPCMSQRHHWDQQQRCQRCRHKRSAQVAIFSFVVRFFGGFRICVAVLSTSTPSWTSPLRALPQRPLLAGPPSARLLPPLLSVATHVPVCPRGVWRLCNAHPP